jgi:hypothetical protein
LVSALQLSDFIISVQMSDVTLCTALVNELFVAVHDVTISLFFCVGVENKLETCPAAEGSEDNAA